MMQMKKILIVDDDPDFQLVLQKCLKKEGYACTSCWSAEEALNQVGVVNPNLVILDLGFGRASGLAFLENYAKSFKEPQSVPPVLVVSGYADREIVEFVTTLGASRFLAKPVGADQIISAVQSLIH